MKSDLYPDARPCLEKLKQLGFVVGAAGNQTVPGGTASYSALDLPLDFIGTSAGWGVEKPSAGVLRQDRRRMWLRAG